MSEEHEWADIPPGLLGVFRYLIEHHMYADNNMMILGLISRLMQPDIDLIQFGNTHELVLTERGKQLALWMKL